MEDESKIKKYKELLKNANPIINFDDKDLVIISLTIIAIFSLFKIASPIIIISNIVSGLLGIATGKKLG